MAAGYDITTVTMMVTLNGESLPLTFLLSRNFVTVLYLNSLKYVACV